ncbi:3-deoxy-D-manno-octulosonic acid transferase [Rubellimicrobium arenae]|uniref:3-deoxy-D-manno-octulosonic acid transferase n=1 Tax=Rubellimicrobium arenae TaxID=2817372 RepID=UPI001B306466|nr:glycosyltransferase N-terminal domain-containing protein [Rubellimicrobium arenae]
MPGSLVLGAYLALAALGGGRSEAEPPRPDGSLLWVHLDGVARLPSLIALTEQLPADVSILVTLPRGTDLPPTTGRMILRHVPHEGGGSVQAFLDHWTPDALLWVGGGLRPALLAKARMPKLLVEGAPDPQIMMRGAGWPWLARSVVPFFDRALVAGDAAAERLARAGLSDDRLEIAGSLDAPAPVLPCNERERRDLAQSLGARPVWLAGDLPLAELPSIVAAYLHASRTAHRLLLILAPRHADEAPAFARALNDAGLRVAERAEGDEPEDGTQVYLADGPSEMGLWLRLAPLAYLGGTLTDGAGGRHPFEAAALGSVLIHGPVTMPHAAAWARLDAAGAARVILNGAELGRAVEALLAPDKAAAMAHAGWDVATQGAEVANRVADLIRVSLAHPAPSGPAAEAPALANPASA